MTVTNEFTIDRKDFETYRIRRRHRRYGVEIIPNRMARHPGPIG
jgi:hypothetical protein